MNFKQLLVTCCYQILPVRRCMSQVFHCSFVGSFFFWSPANLLAIHFSERFYVVCLLLLMLLVVQSLWAIFVEEKTRSSVCPYFRSFFWGFLFFTFKCMAFVYKLHEKWSKKGMQNKTKKKQWWPVFVLVQLADRPYRGVGTHL